VKPLTPYEGTRPVATPIPIVASKTGGGTWSDERRNGEDSDLAAFSDGMSFTRAMVSCWPARNKYQMRPSSKSAKVLMIVFGVFALLVTWIGFQLGTHRHTGILRTLANAKHVLSEASTSAKAQQRTASAPTGRQHNVTLSWKASTSPIVGYNLYRRGTSGVVKLNVEPIPGTSYVDRMVQPGRRTFMWPKRRVQREPRA